MEVKAPSPTLGLGWRALLVGLAGGFISGLVGVGGGVVLVPALVYLLGFRQHRAHVNSLAIIVLVASSALVRYGTAGQVAWALVPPMALGGAVGSFLGARLMTRLSERALRLFFGLAMLAVAAIMLTR